MAVFAALFQLFAWKRKSIGVSSYQLSVADIWHLGQQGFPQSAVFSVLEPALAVEWACGERVDSLAVLESPPGSAQQVQQRRVDALSALSPFGAKKHRSQNERGDAVGGNHYQSQLLREKSGVFLPVLAFVFESERSRASSHESSGFQHFQTDGGIGTQSIGDVHALYERRADRSGAHRSPSVVGDVSIWIWHGVPYFSRLAVVGFG